MYVCEPNDINYYTSSNKVIRVVTLEGGGGGGLSHNIMYIVSWCSEYLHSELAPKHHE